MTEATKPPAGYYFLIASGSRTAHLGPRTHDDSLWVPICEADLPSRAARRGEDWCTLDEIWSRPPCQRCAKIAAKKESP